MARSRRRLSALIVVIGFAVVGAGRAEGPVLTGTSGPAFSISLKNADGSAAQHLDPGAATLVVHDLSDIHNFHLTGPGVDMSTQVETLEDATWNLSFSDGSYRFLCDAHPTAMRGSFTVGDATASNPSPKAAVVKLRASVGPGVRISLRTAAGARVRKLKRGVYSISVSDRSKTENFHLVGPGVNRRTGLTFTGSVTWKLKLAAGKLYRYRSDGNPRLRGSFRAT